LCLLVGGAVYAQHRHKRTVPSAPKIKKDILTLRYKPQAGTLLYNIKTEIDQSIASGAKDYRGAFHTDAQLAFHNRTIDYKHGIWTFDEYFTKFDLSNKALLGDSVGFREGLAVDRVTELTYNMQGDELAKLIVDTMKLLNTEAQTNAYFLQPPRMLIPLPEHAVTYGDIWKDHHVDTISVRDTVNLGITTGAYIYDVSWNYHLASLLDTNNHYYAIIVATDSGRFSGFQTNSETKVTTHASGPIVGNDTTVLDLFSGSVMKRSIDLAIPAKVNVASDPPFIDRLAVHSIVTLDESNATILKNN
jgi:hypothetical protein